MESSDKSASPAARHEAGSDDTKSSSGIQTPQVTNDKSLIVSSFLEENYYPSDHVQSSVRPTRSNIAILVPPVKNRWEYQLYRGESEVQDVLEEYEDLGELQYLVKFSDGHESEVSRSSTISSAQG